MGGKEALSALGYSRIRRVGGHDGKIYLPETWDKELPSGIKERLYVSGDTVSKCLRTTFEDYQELPTRGEMLACIKRMDELAAGNTD